VKKIVAGLLTGGLLLGAAAAAGGTAQDPLIPLSYFINVYQATVQHQADSRVDAATGQQYQTALSDMETAQEAAINRLGGTSGLDDQRLKRGDVVTLPSGSTALLLAGSASCTFPSGALVDVTDGKTVASGVAASLRHRYLAAEGTTAALTITSDTAVVCVEGAVTVAKSKEIDYNALADALKEMGLFQGTGQSYGSGYELERQATRVEGIVMFLRLINEENAALAYTGTCPFADAPDWSKRYLAYAYSKGYTNGVGVNAAGQELFGSNNIIDATQYVTFVLRALGYSDSGSTPDFSWSGALSAGQSLGLLTQGEVSLLGSGTFLRAQMAYVSYYALDGMCKNSGETLLKALEKGGWDAKTAQEARAFVTVSRPV